MVFLKQCTGVQIMLIDNRAEFLIKEYADLRRTFADELRGLPKGTLTLSKNGKYMRFLHVYKENGKWLQKSITSQPEKVQSLARAAFLRESIRRIDRNALLLNDLKRDLLPLDETAVLRSLPQVYETLPSEYFTHANGSKLFCPNPVTDGSVRVREASLTTEGLSAREWGLHPYAANTKYLEKKNKRLANGLLVRSKSEGEIAERYLQRGICFHYDEIVRIGKRILSPDFIFARPDGFLIYHEHFGRTDDPRYNRDVFIKLQLYASVGIVPWRNLILTYERADEGLDYRLLEAEIDAKIGSVL